MSLVCQFNITVAVTVAIFYSGGLSCKYIVSPCGRTGNRTVTQMRHPLLVEGRPNCARQSLASTLSAPHVAATSYSDPRHHANAVTPCLLAPCLNVPNLYLYYLYRFEYRKVLQDFLVMIAVGMVMISLQILDGRNRAIAIAEPLARVIAAIQIASVRWRSHLPRNTQKLVLTDPAYVRCAAIRIARLAFIGVVFVPRGTAEWLARVGHVRWALAIGDWRFCPSKLQMVPRNLLEPSSVVGRSFLQTVAFTKVLHIQSSFTTRICRQRSANS